MAGASITISDFQPRLEVAMHQLGLSEERVKAANKRGLSAMGAWMVAEMRKAVEPSGQQQPGSSKPWPPLSPAWSMIKAAQGRPAHMGVYEGFMQNSFSFDVRTLEVEAGPTVEHAERFDSLRPITPYEPYARDKFAQVMIDAMESVR